jgi:uncharacterized damage-inducible protein DinB
MARRVLTLEPIADDPEVGRWLAAMQDARRDTVRELEGLTDDAINRTPTPDEDSIGTILYHVALIEADWLLVDVLGPEAAPEWPAHVFPYAARDADDHLTGVADDTLATHLDRLDVVRALLLEHLQPMPAEEFHRLRARYDYDVSAAWVIHHLLQPEAEHRAQIGAIKQAFQHG